MFRNFALSLLLLFGAHTVFIGGAQAVDEEWLKHCQAILTRLSSPQMAAARHRYLQTVRSLLGGLEVPLPTKDSYTAIDGTPFFMSPLAAISSRPDLASFKSPKLVAIEMEGHFYPIILLLPEPENQGVLYTSLVADGHSEFGITLQQQQEAFVSAFSGLARFSSVGGGLAYVKRSFDQPELQTLPVFPSVFPPDSVYSQKLLEEALPKIKPKQKVLVVGSGAGKAAILAAKKTTTGADAVDIKPLAVANTQASTLFAETPPEVRAWQSDLFSQVPGKYDVILFVAPLAVTKELAEKAGKSVEDFHDSLEQMRQNPNINLRDPNGDLLRRMFNELPQHLHPGGKLILMSHKDISSLLPKGLNSKLLRSFQENQTEFGIHEITVREKSRLKKILQLK